MYAKILRNSFAVALVVIFVQFILYGQETIDIKNLNEADFSDTNCCWKYHFTQNEYMKGAKLIESYLGLPREEKLRGKKELQFAAGQLYIYAGDQIQGVKWLKKAKPCIALLRADKTWKRYINGTLAFLKDDKDKLLKNIDRLKKVEPLGYKIIVLKRINQFWGEPYPKAVGDIF